jgi:inhibitor of KinA
MYRYIECGDSALIIKTGDDISMATNSVVRKLLVLIEDHKIEGVIDIIPSYNELMVYYEPGVISHDRLRTYLNSLTLSLEEVELPAADVVHIPVLYGGEAGPDFHDVAEINQLTENQVIKIHCSVDYYVYMLGFTPGFCYLGGMDERIAAPRKKTPRLSIPAGSVGIAGRQTGVYPIDSPGGWQLIGITPLKLFDLARRPEFLIRSGDYIKFFPVDHREYNDIKAQLKEGRYQVVKSNKHTT